MDTAARIAPLTGLVSIVLIGAGAVVIGFYEYLPNPEEARTFLTDEATRVRFGAWMGPLAALFLLWFSGSVRAALRTAEGGDGRVSAIAFGGGVLAAAGLAFSQALLYVGAERAGSETGITAVTAASLFDAAGIVIVVGMAFGLAAMMFAFAVVSLRTGFVSSWAAWVSAIIALAALTPWAWLVLVGQLLWVGVVSIFLYRKATTAVPAMMG